MLIEGEREIHLVTWNESHFHQLYPIANNPKIAMNLRDSYPHPYTIHDARHWIEHNQKFNPAQNFAIEYDADAIIDFTQTNPFGENGDKGSTI